MARKKQQPAIKGNVHIRFKSLAKGRQSVYLDIYHNGKRYYEFLKDDNGNKLVLYPNLPEYKKINDATMLQAEKIRLRTEAQVINQEYIERDKRQVGKVLLLDWVQICIDEELAKKDAGKSNTMAMIQRMLATLKKYAKQSTRLCDVDKQFCLGYIDFLSTTKMMRWSDEKSKPDAKTIAKRDNLQNSTISAYFASFGRCLQRAFEKGYIASNPIGLITKDEKIKIKEKLPTHLLEHELVAFARVECKNESEQNVKQAFMFSCFTGYRFGDVKGLKWGDIVDEGNGVVKVIVATQKTGEIVPCYLNENAKSFLPERGSKTNLDLVFDLHYCLSWVEKSLDALTKRAGINKHVTFHKARHTCATLALTKGSSLPVVSKMLGHKHISTTLIYAKVVDASLREASNAINISL